MGKDSGRNTAPPLPGRPGEPGPSLYPGTGTRLHPPSTCSPEPPSLASQPCSKVTPCFPTLPIRPSTSPGPASPGSGFSPAGQFPLQMWTGPFLLGESRMPWTHRHGREDVMNFLLLQSHFSVCLFFMVGELLSIALLFLCFSFPPSKCFKSKRTLSPPSISPSSFHPI